MPGLKSRLKSKLKGVRRLGVLGIGSDLRADDAAGMLVAAGLKSWPPARRGVRVRVFCGGIAPESLTGEIKRFKPTHLLMVDAADLGAKAGTACLFDVSQETDAVSCATHRMPLKIFAAYLRHFFPCDIIGIGIQPKTLAFGQQPSVQIQRASRRISRIIREVAGEASH